MSKLLDASGKIVAIFAGYSDIDGCEMWRIVGSDEIVSDYDIRSRFGKTSVVNED